MSEKILSVEQIEAIVFQSVELYPSEQIKIAQAIHDALPEPVSVEELVDYIKDVIEGRNSVIGCAQDIQKFTSAGAVARIKELEKKIEDLEGFETIRTLIAELNEYKKANGQNKNTIKNAIARIDTLTAQLEEMKSEFAKLQDPTAVWVNICRGTIAKPSQLEYLEKQLEEMTRQRDVATDGLMKAQSWFEEYAISHEAKGKMDKANRNRERQLFCLKAVNEATHD